MKLHSFTTMSYMFAIILIQKNLISRLTKNTLTITSLHLY